MIEIIREEESGGTTERHGLPKDIKQIGKPDIGDRIYVENEVYQFLHPYSNIEEKRAYVLLGRFENYAGRDCVFVEAAILLEEMSFDGEMPLWSDHTWAYIYKQLRREYDSMVIVGWAMDIKGQLPNMTMRLEQLHQNNFGGAHQILFLMDSLEQEEAFYGNKNGHLHRREGFYVYYDKKNLSYVKGNAYIESETQVVYEESDSLEDEKEAWNYHEENSTKQEAWNAYAKDADETSDYRDGSKEWRGDYRRQVAEREERRAMPSYASTAILAVVVCALGITAYLNNEKMNAMEQTLAQMNQTQAMETQMQTEAPEVAVENVVGNVQKQENESVVQTNENASVDVGASADTVSSAVAVEGQNTDGSADAAQTDAVAQADSVAQTDTAVQTDNVAQTDTAVQTDSATQTADATQSADAVQAAGTEQTTETTTTMTEAQTYLSQGYYIVQKGDSLAGICKKIYQTTAMMDKLCEVNEIEDEDAIYAGQSLTLPN